MCADFSPRNAGRLGKLRLPKGPRSLIAPGVVALAAAAVVAIWWLVAPKDRTAPPTEPAPVNVEVLKIKAEAEVVDSFTLEGEIEPRDVVDISAQVTGNVQELCCKEGQPVLCALHDPDTDEDPVLIRLDDEEFKIKVERSEAVVAQRQADVKSAEAKYSVEQTEYERIKKAKEKGSASEIELAQAKARLDSAEAALARAKAILREDRAALGAAQLDLRRTSIRAPICGKVNKIFKKKGAHVNAGQNVVQIVDDSKFFKVVVDVPERDIGFVKEGDEAVVILNDRVKPEKRSKDDAIRTEVTYVDARADELARTTRVEMQIKNKTYELSNGETFTPHDRRIVSVRLARRKYKNVILIPLKAIIPRENDKVVYVVGQDGTAKLKKVEIGFFRGNEVQVRTDPDEDGEGLTEGDVLIVKGHQFVGPGQKVVVPEVEKTEPPAKTAMKPERPGRREAGPDVKTPRILITTIYAGASPEDIEKTITRVIEKELAGLGGLKEMKSVNAHGKSTITCEFLPNVDIDEAILRVKDKVDNAEAELPQDADEPVVTEVIAKTPIVTINIAGDVWPAKLKSIVEELEDRIEAIPGVLEVRSKGLPEREISIELDEETLASYDLDLESVVRRLREENVNIFAGGLRTPGSKFNVRVPTEPAEPDEIKRLQVASHNGKPVYLSDIAIVTDGFAKDQDGAETKPGTASLAVFGARAADVEQVFRTIKATVTEFRAAMPEGVRVKLVESHGDRRAPGRGGEKAGGQAEQQQDRAGGS